MIFEFLIASKQLNQSFKGKKIANPIIRIAIICIAISIAVNILTLSVVTGFKNEVANKVLGFGAHAYISNQDAQSIYENEPFKKSDKLVKLVKNQAFVKNIVPVAYKPAMLQSNKNKFNTQEIQSVLIKGVESSYNFSFFKTHLVEGKLPNYGNKDVSKEILVSSSTMKKLFFKIGDEVSVFFVKQKPIKRKLKIVGVFETGMEDFDNKTVIADLKLIQELNDWGIKTEINLLDSTFQDNLIVKATSVGGNGNYRYDFGKGYQPYAGFTYFPSKDTVFKVIASDYWTNLNEEKEDNTISDTAFLHVKIEPSNTNYERFPLDANGILKKTYLNDSSFYLERKNKRYVFTLTKGKGSQHYYTGLYEIQFQSWDNFDEQITLLQNQINFNPIASNLYITSLKDVNRDIFLWLGFLDINVLIIVVLMLLIGVINMGSALLVLIISKTNFIGLMKTLGCSNWSLRKIFLYQIALLCLKGMFWGNIIGISIVLIQDYFSIFKLNPSVYYLSSVPVELTFTHLILINVLTITVCVLALILPSYIISKISPAKSIKTR